MADNQTERTACGSIWKFSWNAQALASSAGLACAGFSASASWLLVFFYCWTPELERPMLLSRLLLKATFFTVAVLAIIIWQYRLLARRPEVPAETASAEKPRALCGKILLMAGVLATLCGWNVARYPHIEPDEAHHMIVARNVAFHGVYGSGMPATGFRPFDEYDSVGPTVIVPVAAAMNLANSRIVPARLTMVIFFIGLSIAVFVFCVQSGVSAWSSFVGALFIASAPGSLYLSRTLYGEVPAMLFLICALVAWNCAANRHSKLAFGFAALAGALLGCAIVTKYVLVLAIWPAVGAFAHDRLTRRVIQPAHGLIMGGVAFLAFGTWLSVTTVYGAHGAGSVISEYRLLLTFGIDSIPTAIAWFQSHMLTMTAYLLIGLPCAYRLARTATNNPAISFLALFGVFSVYWWIFFTTCAMPRYLWYGLAIWALFSGIGVADALQTTRQQGSMLRKVAYGALIALGVVCALQGFPGRCQTFLTADEMAEDYALGRYVHDRFAAKRIASTFYPVSRLLNLLYEIPVERVGTTDLSRFDLLVVDTLSEPHALNAFGGAEKIGRYALIQPSER